MDLQQNKMWSRQGSIYRSILVVDLKINWNEQQNISCVSSTDLPLCIVELPCNFVSSAQRVATSLLPRELSIAVGN